MSSGTVDLAEAGRIDEALRDIVTPEDDALRAIRAATADADMPAIEVSGTVGKLLTMLAQLLGARRVLEVGTLGGYSTTCFARGVGEGGHVLTLELSPDHAQVARANFERAGVADRVEVRVGPASDSLAQLVGERPEPFDIAFIDADKQSNPEYVGRALELVRVGGIVIVDNVVRRGGFLEPAGDASNEGARAALELFGSEPRLDGTALQLVGAKGWDGFAIARVVA